MSKKVGLNESRTEKKHAIRARAWEDLVRQMTHGKDLKEIPHTLDMSVIKGVKFKTEKRDDLL